MGKTTRMGMRAIALTGVMAALIVALAGCAGGEGNATGDSSGASDNTVPFEMYAGDQLDAEGIALLGEGPVPREGWAVSDGRLQVQLIAGSIPGISVSDIRFSEGGEVAVTLEAVEGPSTMDIAFFEIVADVGDREVSSVTLDRGDGSGAVALEKLG